MGTRQELLRLPNVTPGVLAGFEAALMAKRGDKDQRAQIKKLLFNSGARACPRLFASCGTLLWVKMHVASCCWT